MFSSHSSWTNRIGLLLALAVAGAVLADRFGLGIAPAAVAPTLYNWALLLGAFALILGVANALWFHLAQVQRGQAEWPLSLLLLLTFAIVFVAGVSSAAGAASPLLEWVFDALLAPGQATLFALTGFFLLGAAYRYLRLDRPGGVWILSGTLLLLLVQTPFPRRLMPEVLVSLVDWLLIWPVMAALRGVLLGGALAVLFISLRLILRSAR